MRLVYVGLVGFFIGGIMLGPGFRMHWPGVAVILVGACALGLYIRNLWLSENDMSEVVHRGPAGSYTIEDFNSQFENIVLPANGNSIRSLPDQVDVSPDGINLVVGYGEYLSSIPLTDDVQKMFSGQHLSLALQASPGADQAKPKWVGHENQSGLCEDDFVRYECRFRVSPANVLALRATRFAWTASAEQLAAVIAPSEVAIEAVRQRMAKLARELIEAFERIRALTIQRSEAEPGSVEAVAIDAELRKLADDLPKSEAEQPEQVNSVPSNFP